MNDCPCETTGIRPLVPHTGRPAPCAHGPEPFSPLPGFGPGVVPSAIGRLKHKVEELFRRKADRATGGAGNFAALDADGNPVDSGIAAATAASGTARVLPDYLYALEFDDTYPEDAEAFYRTYDAGGACSAVRRGAEFSRNYDWYYDEAATFVVRVTATEGRHASVGVASLGDVLTDAKTRSGVYNPLYRALPGMTLDGVNDAGVFACVNVVPAREDEGWAEDGDLCALGAVRHVLDTADSAVTAAAYLADHVYIPAKARAAGHSFHFMVGDATSTWIVEDGQAVEVTGSAGPVMTNFRVTADSGDGYAYDPEAGWARDPYGTGRERFDILAAGGTADDVRFREAYRRPFTRLTEFAAEGVASHDNLDALRIWAEAHVPQGAPESLTRGGGSWQTVHSSVYDLEAKTLSVAVQESVTRLTFALAVDGEGEAAVARHNRDTAAHAALFNGKRGKDDLVYDVPRLKNEWLPIENYPGSGLDYDWSSYSIVRNGTSYTLLDAQGANAGGWDQTGSGFSGASLVFNGVNSWNIPWDTVMLNITDELALKSGIPSTIGWNNVTGKPNAFPPSTHGHTADSWFTTALAGKLSTSAKLSDLHDESGNPTTDNKVMLKTDGGLETRTNIYNGTITLDHLSENFEAHVGSPYDEVPDPPTGAWKGPFVFGGSEYYVPASLPDPTTEQEAQSDWNLWITSQYSVLWYKRGSSAGLDGSINRAEFASISHSEPMAGYIYGQAFFTRAATTQTKTFATTAQIPDISGKLDKSGGEMTVPMYGGYKIKFIGDTGGQNDGVAIVNSTGSVVVLLGVQSGQLCVAAPNFYGGEFGGSKVSISGGYTTLETDKMTHTGWTYEFPSKSGTLALTNDIPDVSGLVSTVNGVTPTDGNVDVKRVYNDNKDEMIDGSGNVYTSTVVRGGYIILHDSNGVPDRRLAYAGPGAWAGSHIWRSGNNAIVYFSDTGKITYGVGGTSWGSIAPLNIDPTVTGASIGSGSKGSLSYVHHPQTAEFPQNPSAHLARSVKNGAATPIQAGADGSIDVSPLFSNENDALISVINDIVGVPNALLEAALSGEEVA